MMMKNLTLKTCSLAVLLVGSLLGTQSILAAPILINGSLTGAIANGGVPTGWTVLSPSPDTMDETTTSVGPLAVLGQHLPRLRMAEPGSDSLMMVVHLMRCLGRRYPDSISEPPTMFRGTKQTLVLHQVGM